MSTSTSRSLARPAQRPSLSKSNTISSPNLSAAYTGQQISVNKINALARKSSLSALTHGSLATIPDASAGYALSAVLNANSQTPGNMAQFTPARGVNGEDLDVGDLVDVPGNMHGTVRFIGNVDGKKGTFAGVELSEEFAKRGKNNGDVDG